MPGARNAAPPTEQARQVSCFADVAAALAPGGRFVMEAFVPDVGRFDRGPRTDGRLAGLELEHRWGGWARQPFTAT